MLRDTDATVLVIDDDQERAEAYASWLEGYTTRVVCDGERALDALDEVTVVLLDADLADPPAGELLGRVRARRPACQVGLLSAGRIETDVFRLDVDEYVLRPLDRDELRETVRRLADRGAIEEAVETYLSLVTRRRRIENRRGDDDLTEDERYRELTGEILARRQQISSLLEQVDDSVAEADTSLADRPDRAPPAKYPDVAPAVQPLYRDRPAAFYGLWLVAGLTYGVGDVVSTLYATVVVPGLIEGNPAVAAVLANFGLAGFLLLKALVFLVLISVSVQGARSRERFSYYWPPVAATAVGLLLTAWNLRLAVGA